MKQIVPVAAILPTRNRAKFLERFLRSLHEQTVLPAEIVICDASDDEATAMVVKSAIVQWQGLEVQWRYERAARRGLAPQRNQGVATATKRYVWFLDDDVILEPLCLEKLHQVIDSDPQVGGLTATITNQSYSSPGRFTRQLMKWFEDGNTRSSYAASCIGPGYAFMPSAASDIPETVDAEWLIGCCSLYRKAALPVPAVPDHFEDGALGEDLAASLSVGKTQRLLHVRDARCYHDSQGGDHKRSLRRLADQGLRNRYFIMTQVMGKTTLRDRFDFALIYAFTLLCHLSRPSEWSYLWPKATGYLQAMWKLLNEPSHV
jgi:GT2 family glycosyltransferase